MTAVQPAGAWGAWAPDPGVLALAALVLAAYLRGLRRIRRRAGARRVVRPWQPLSFATGLVLVVGAVVSPLEAMGEALFSAHMGQHLLLGLVGPLLLVLGRPFAVAAWGLDDGTRGVLRRWGRRSPIAVRRSPAGVALVAVAAHAGTLWLVHAPPVYRAALRHDVVHAAEHAALLGTGLLFWSVVSLVRWRQRTVVGMFALFVATLQSGALAALLAFAPTPLYGTDPSVAGAWGLTPLSDQQLAGAIMWMPAGLVYAAAALVMFVRWLESGPPRRPRDASEGRRWPVGAVVRERPS